VRTALILLILFNFAPLCADEIYIAKHSHDFKSSFLPLEIGVASWATMSEDNLNKRFYDPMAFFKEYL
jgi:hypothetical protein